VLQGIHIDKQKETAKILCRDSQSDVSPGNKPTIFPLQLPALLASGRSLKEFLKYILGNWRKVLALLHLRNLLRERRQFTVWYTILTVYATIIILN
jgi:hypothetical protein